MNNFYMPQQHQNQQIKKQYQQPQRTSNSKRVCSAVYDLVTEVYRYTTHAALQRNCKKKQVCGTACKPHDEHDSTVLEFVLNWRDFS